MSRPIFIYGFHSIQAQIDSNPQYIIKVYTLDSRKDKRLNTLISKLNKHNINITKTNKQQLEKLANKQTHQGVVAQILLPSLPNHNQLIEYISNLDSLGLILILDSIQDPRNLGACLRSANAFGVNCVIIGKDDCAPINALVHKTSAGALNRLKIFQVTNLARSIKALKEKDIWVVGLDGKANQSIYQIDMTTKTAIVMGSEGSGLRKLTKDLCDYLAKIPMSGNVDSLNVAVATGITLAEVNRQKYPKG